MLNELFMKAFGCEERLLEPLYGEEIYNEDDNKENDYMELLEDVYDYLDNINEWCQEDTGRYPTLEEWLMHIECEEFEQMFGSVRDNSLFRSDVLDIIDEMMYCNSVETYRTRKGE